MGLPSGWWELVLGGQMIRCTLNMCRTSLQDCSGDRMWRRSGARDAEMGVIHVYSYHRGSWNSERVYNEKVANN